MNVFQYVFAYNQHHSTLRHFQISWNSDFPETYSYEHLKGFKQADVTIIPHNSNVRGVITTSN